MPRFNLLKLMPSPACWIQNMPWKIFIEPVIRDNQKYLSIFVSCAAPITNVPWSCRASVRMYKLDGLRPKIIKTTQFLTFDSSASTSWGHDTFILWDTVLNPANGFIRDDSVTIEIIIDAQTPQGFKLTPTYFTDERATVAVKLCDQSILNLQSKIKDLTNENEVLQATNKTSNEQIENLKKLLDVTNKKSAELEKNFNDEHNTNIELQKSIDDSKEQLDQERENNATLTKTLSEKTMEIEALNKKLQDFNTIEDELNSCKTQNDEALKKYTALLDDFENYKKITTSTGSESENVLKTQIVAMKNENIALKRQFSSVQTELNSAKAKLKDVDTLEKNVEKLSAEKEKMQITADSIAKNLSEAENIINMIRKEANEELAKSKKENDNNKTKIQSLKSRLYESLVKVQISQDMNEEIQKIKEEKNKLMEQMKVGYEKYNDLKQERTELYTRIDNLNKQLTDANEEINNLKTKAESAQTEIKNCQEQLAVSSSSVSDLKKANEDLKKTLDEANSKIESFENSNSENITNLVNDKNNLKNENDSLKSQLQTITKELAEIKKQKIDDQVSLPTSVKTDLENKLASVNEELNETKAQLKEARKDVNKLILFERNLSSLKSQFDVTKIELQQLKDKKLDQVISKLNKEKTDLQNLLSSLKLELEETKTKLNNTPNNITSKSSEDENVKLRKEISYLQDMLDRTNTKIKTISDQKNENSNKQNQINQNEDPGSEVDIVKTTGNEKNEPIQKQKVVKTPGSSGQEDVEDLNEFPSKDSFQLRLEAMKGEFENQIKNADHAMQIERETLMKRIDDLLYHLSEEKYRNVRSEIIGTKLKDEICRLKEEKGALGKLKNDFSTQLETVQRICTNTFQIIIDILTNLRASGKLSCTVEAVIISFFNSIKQCKQLSAGNMMQNTKSLENQQVNSQISTDVLQEKLDQLKANHEESLNIIRKNCVLEHNENGRLRTANNELLVAIETETRVRKQYGEMLKIANSRLENYRKQFNELDNKLLDEKNKRYECEDMNRRSKVINDGMECLLNDMTQKLLRHAIELSDIEDETQPAQDDSTIFSCSQRSSTAGNALDSPAKITNESSQNGDSNDPGVFPSNAQETQHNASSDMAQTNQSTIQDEKNSSTMRLPENVIESTTPVAEKQVAKTSVNLT